MTERRFCNIVTDLYYGWSDVALLTYKVGKRNVAVYYSATDDGDALQPIKKPPYLIRVTTLGRYPQLVKSERMSTLKDALLCKVEGVHIILPNIKSLLFGYWHVISAICIRFQYRSVK